VAVGIEGWLAGERAAPALAAAGRAPLAVNLSFGRWIKEVQDPSLAAEIEKTIDHLVNRRGIPVLAAAPWDDLFDQEAQPSLRFIVAENGVSYWVSIPLRLIERKK
jgi:hypothetical protein